MRCHEKVITAVVIVSLVLCINGYSSYSLAQQAVDKVVVYKSERRLELHSGVERMKTYRVSLGRNPTGHKQQQGDSRTPEGEYRIDYRNPQSRFYLSMHINYPNERDRQRARRRGVNPGGDIFIHGLPNGHGTLGNVYSRIDWTDGCIAVSNQAMLEIWGLVKNGTTIVIYP